MALFDRVLDQTNAQFNLGEKSSALLAALLAVVNENGLAAFLEKFRRAGLGRVADSWVTNGANTALSPGQLADGLGTENLKSVAQKAEVPLETAIPALALMIPQTVDLMTPDGVIGNRRSNDGEAAFMQTAEVSASGGSLLRSILPLVLLAFLVGIGYLTCRPNQTTRFAPTATSDSINANRIHSNTASSPTSDVNGNSETHSH